MPRDSEDSSDEVHELVFASYLHVQLTGICFGCHFEVTLMCVTRLNQAGECGVWVGTQRGGGAGASPLLRKISWTIEHENMLAGKAVRPCTGQKQLLVRLCHEAIQMAAVFIGQVSKTR